jgi:hypothetical protein
MSRWYASVERFVVDLPEDGAPRPKWWYFRLLNVLFAFIFLAATAYHISGLDAPGAGRCVAAGAEGKSGTFGEATFGEATFENTTSWACRVASPACIGAF